MTLPYSAVLPGRPATKKNRGRIVRHPREDRHILLPEAKYLTWERGVVSRLFYLTAGRLPRWDVPMSCAVTFYEHPMQRGDFGGYWDALSDALQAAGLVKNDRYFRAVTGAIARDRHNPRVEFTLHALLGEGG